MIIHEIQKADLPREAAPILAALFDGLIEQKCPDAVSGYMIFDRLWPEILKFRNQANDGLIFDKFKIEKVNLNCYKLYLFGHFIGASATQDAVNHRAKSIADGITRFIHDAVNKRYNEKEHARETKLERERDVLEYKLRKWMWENHGKHSSASLLYGDDGEMQCNHVDHGPFDFRRESIAQLEARIFEWHMKQINEAGKKLEMEVSKFVDSEDKCVCYPKPERFIPHQSCGAVGRAL